MQRNILILIFLTLAVSVHAENRYVTDQILIALRPAQNDTAEPLEYLPTGMRVEVVEDLGAFIKIKSATGKVGFARSKYFIPTPPSGTTTATADVRKELTEALQRNAELTAEVQHLKTVPSDLAKTTILPDQEKVRSELAATLQERDQLQQEVARLKESGKKDILPVPSSISQLQWFLAGAAILLLGWFAGKSSRSKRRY